MSFWEEFGDALAKSAEAAVGTPIVTKWVEISSFDEMRREVATFVRNASSDAINMARKGFVHHLAYQTTLNNVARLLEIHQVFCVEQFKRFGDGGA